MIQTEIPVPEVPQNIPSGTEAFQELKGLSFDDAISKIANTLVEFSFKLLIAILIFYLGRFIIRKIYKTIFTNDNTKVVSDASIFLDVIMFKVVL